MIKDLHEIKICANSVELAERAAERFAQAAGGAVAGHGRFCVCLSGGSTPRAMYTRLAEDPWRSRVPWPAVHVFWGDERCVPRDHPDNLYAMAWELLLSRVPVPAENIHRMPGEAENPETAAAAYEDLLREFFGLKIGRSPRFDLILLGLGADGHTASLFPGTAGLTETQRLVAANYVPVLNARRLTLTLPVLNNAAQIMFLVTGASKAEVVRSLWGRIGEDQYLPAGLINPQSGRVLWLIDQAAASLLDPSYLGSADDEA
ncbi:MAG: 6-phosphogluconolactonase [Deltaproteobacteria bacterium]|nr:6-phosphogluconolactonase [Deltaproteobacteria bacterium]MBF0525090.1 6-phosphogluconolactonase [Deltaproteobacteria bacterium]